MENQAFIRNFAIIAHVDHADTIEGTSNFYAGKVDK